MDVTFRKLTRRDLDVVMDIEEQCKPNAWGRKVFWSRLRDPLTRARILEVRGKPRAFSVCAPEGLSCHLLNLAVDPEWRRKGLAVAALEDVETYARRQDLTELHLEVRESNLPAQLLYRKVGFEAVEILHAHYGSDDAYLMKKAVFLEP